MKLTIVFSIVIGAILIALLTACLGPGQSIEKEQHTITGHWYYLEDGHQVMCVEVRGSHDNPAISCNWYGMRDAK